MVEGYGAGVVHFYAEIVFVHDAELVLSGSETLVGGAAVPGQGLGIVLRDTAALEIEIAESKLGLGVAGFGLCAKRIEIVIGGGGRGWLRLGTHGGVWCQEKE